MAAGVQAQRWLENYLTDYPLYCQAAEKARLEVHEALRGYVHGVHTVNARAKHPDSVTEKIDRKKYGRPARQFDDLIGVRVVLLNESSIADTVRRLESMFMVDQARSSNKTASLQLREVGYRSSHVVLKCKGDAVSDDGRLLRQTFVEVQVRSVLAHAWAEIEHSLRYKAGTGVPAELARRFDAVAGTLELVDREFNSIETDIVQSIHVKSQAYASGNGLEDELSSLQLLACLATCRPTMKALGPHGLKLEMEDAFRLAKELSGVGVATVEQFLSALSEGATLQAIRDYATATLSTVDPEEASGIVVCGVIVGLRNPARFLSVQKFQQEPALQSLFSSH
ncbi:hypothetical protein FHE66_14565 [Georgenia sp. 311]|uniref:GTP pyrophosphokinase n=1 Tax=Georgenia sp. 311 TaxID=2585134 RepID=UPI00111249F2|nr:hypothetical protein [Georgenia sp. 311]TNC16598.1 hypothetical protein FHE66_14565 [Georgenia sp. 311]